jgi:hypothetical protein
MRQRTSKRIVMFVASLVVAMAAMAGTAFGHGSMEKMQASCDLQALKSDPAYANKGLQKRLNTAIEYIQMSLNPSYWRIDPSKPLVWTTCGKVFDSHDLVHKGSGSKVFDYEKKAAYQLHHFLPGTSFTGAWDVADHLVLVDMELAQNAINDAIARGGSSSKINDANKMMAIALGDYTLGSYSGFPDNRIDTYKDAWQKADQA